MCVYVCAYIHYTVPSFLSGHYTLEMMQNVLGGTQISVYWCGYQRSTLGRGDHDHYTRSVVGGNSDDELYIVCAFPS